MVCSLFMMFVLCAQIPSGIDSSSVTAKAFQDWPRQEMKKQNFRIEDLNYKIFLDDIDKDLTFPESRWPNDVLIREKSEEPSMDRDLNGDLYAVFVSPIDSGGYIYKSANGGANWVLWKHFAPAGIVITPSICVTATNIVVVCETSNHIFCHWRRKDGSDYSIVPLNLRWSECPSIDNPGPDVDHSVLVVYRGIPQMSGINDEYLIFQFSNDGGETWSAQDTVIKATSCGVKCDGAITVAEQSSHIKAIITYYSPLGTLSKDIYVLRSNPTGWDQVHQITGGTGTLRHDPSIRALDNGSESSILLYYSEYNSTLSDWDLKFSYSYNTGNPGTWSSGSISDPNFWQGHPHLGVGGFGHNYFYVGYWNNNDDNEPKVFGICHYFSNIPNYTIRRASKGNVDLLRKKVAINWYNNSAVPLVVWSCRITSNFNVYCNQADGSPPGIEDWPSESNLNRISLFQNCPNPVSLKTMIKYEIPEKAKVCLKIYDASGKEVATLLDKEQFAGSYELKWDLKDMSKRRLSNGIYFYLLKAGNFKKVRKMVILR
jgi:hypothetical protein